MPDPHTEAPTLDQRLDALLADAEAEERAAKEAFDAAKTRHEAAKKRAHALRTAHGALHGAGVLSRTPEPSNGESVDEGLSKRVRKAKAEEAKAEEAKAEEAA
jgi:hypothetical protein